MKKTFWATEEELKNIIGEYIILNKTKLYLSGFKPRGLQIIEAFLIEQ